MLVRRRNTPELHGKALCWPEVLVVLQLNSKMQLWPACKQHKGLFLGRKWWSFGESSQPSIMLQDAMMRRKLQRAAPPRGSNGGVTSCMSTGICIANVAYIWSVLLQITTRSGLLQESAEQAQTGPILWHLQLKDWKATNKACFSMEGQLISVASWITEGTCIRQHILFFSPEQTWLTVQMKGLGNEVEAKWKKLGRQEYGEQMLISLGQVQVRKSDPPPCWQTVIFHIHCVILCVLYHTVKPSGLKWGHLATET